MSVSTTTQAVSPCLPPEVLSQIFLEVDPHTLYTSVRALSHGWKECVEQRLLASEFETGRWRVGLRVVRKPKMGTDWHGGRTGGRGLEAPGARWNNFRQRVEEQAASDVTAAAEAAGEEVDGAASTAAVASAVQQARHAFAQDIVSRYDALEDELTPVLATDERELTAPIVHVIPLQFKRYDGKSTTLQFSTPNEQLFALFEHEASRLDLDFGIVWRFPGDGQDDEEWGDADPENGWLSRFYCSSFDVRADDDDKKGLTSSSIGLHATPLARRVRRAITRHEDENEEADSDAEDEDDDRQATQIRRARRAAVQQQQPTRPMEWSDKGHEYAALSLSLGTEFFVRRSARANFLTRRLEAEVQATRSRQEASRRRRRDRGAVRTQSVLSTPRRSPSQSQTPSSDATSLLHRQLRVAVAAAAVSSSSSTSSCSRSTTGTSTPMWPAWKAGGSSYAAVASTPPSNRGSFRSRSTGPRVLRVTPPSSDDTVGGSAAPLPSVNASGYTSVQHRVPVDGKEAELQSLQQSFDDTLTDAGDETFTTESTSASPSTRGYTSKMAVSSHFSVPRAHFSARIVRMTGKATEPKAWQGGDAWGRMSSRRVAIDADDDEVSVAVWEWCR